MGHWKLISAGRKCRVPSSISDHHDYVIVNHYHSYVKFLALFYQNLGTFASGNRKVFECTKNIEVEIILLFSLNSLLGFLAG